MENVATRPTEERSYGKPATTREWFVHCLDLLMMQVEKPFNWLQYKIGRGKMPWFFAAPSLTLTGIFTFIPLILGVLYSFTGGDRLLLWERSFVGLENYQALLGGERELFTVAVRNTLVYTVMQVSLTLATSLVTALVLNRSIKGRGFFRAVYFYPGLLSAVAVALVWQWFLNRNGLVNYGLEAIGVDPINFMLDASWSRFWVVFVGFWLSVGFYSLILLAGLQSIPQDIYEAAEIDGTSRFRQFTQLTFPLLLPNILVVTILLTLGAVQTFESAYVLTNGGGPGTANAMIVQFIYEVGVARGFLGLGTAASVMLGLFMMVLTALQFWYSKRKLG